MSAAVFLLGIAIGGFLCAWLILIGMVLSLRAERRRDAELRKITEGRPRRA